MCIGSIFGVASLSVRVCMYLCMYVPLNLCMHVCMRVLVCAVEGWNLRHQTKILGMKETYACNTAAHERCSRRLRLGISLCRS